LQDVGETWDGLSLSAAENMSEEWTPTRVSVLIALWNEGLTTSQIGLRLGVTKNAVVGKVHRLGLPKRGSPIRQKPKPAEVISLAALRPGMCSWPDGEPGKDDFHFCGDPVVPDKPYCADHCGRAYVKISKDGKKTAANYKKFAAA
jgi:GcrA cell cycle regulator